LHSWKSYTSNEANRTLGASGQFWEREYYDHLVRDVEEFESIVRYVAENPAKAHLKNWKWVWVRTARNAGFQPAQEQGRQDAGVTDRSAGFQPTQGQGRQDAGATHVRFRHLWGRTKRQQLLESAIQDGKALYKELDPPLDLGLPFAPAQVRAGYLAWPLLPDSFPVSFPGVKTSRDDVVVDIDRRRLIERMRQYFDPEVSNEEMRRICPSAVTNTARFKAEAVRDQLRKRGFLEQNIVRYCYRPFDVRWLYWEEEADLLDRNRAEYVPHVFPGNAWIEARQKQPMERFDRGYFARTLADNFGNGLSSFFPLYLKDEEAARSLLAKHEPEDARTLPSGIRLNISHSLVSYLGGIAAVADAPDVFYHTLAILHAPAYREENSGALRQDWPRIPLPDSRELLLASAELGKQIAALLDTEAPFVTPASSRQSDDASRMLALQSIAAFTLPPGTQLEEEKDFAVTAGWGHAGKGGVTMPGKGKTIERDYTPAERAAWVGEGSALPLGDRTCDVYLNDIAYWSNIPLRVWEYTIGGYQVIKKWLSYREQKLLGRPLTKEEVRYVQEMARRLAAIILLEPALDENYRRIKEHAYPWGP
jgi:hypothetical protein